MDRMEFPGTSVVEDLERMVQQALATGDEGRLDVIGYGEVTTVIRIDHHGTAFACKRLTPYPTGAAAERSRQIISRYIAALEERGVEVIATDLRVVEHGNAFVLYCVQPALPAAALGPNHLRARSDAEAGAAFERILRLLRASVAPTVAPDGQLANWAFVDERILYLDVSSPFLRDEHGNDLFDFAHQSRALPWPIRYPVRRFVVPQILDKYHDVRGQALDLLGNLRKEKLTHLVPALLPIANRVLDLSPPVTAGEIAVYYRNDARMYAWLQAARRADRWVQRRILGRTYPFLLPPPIARE